jgi:hypothetical protein
MANKKHIMILIKIPSTSRDFKHIIAQFKWCKANTHVGVYMVVSSLHGCDAKW